MRFTTYLRDRQPRLAVVDGEHAIDLADACPARRTTCAQR